MNEKSLIDELAELITEGYSTRSKTEILSDAINRISKLEKVVKQATELMKLGEFTERMTGQYFPNALLVGRPFNYLMLGNDIETPELWDYKLKEAKELQERKQKENEENERKN